MIMAANAYHSIGKRWDRLEKSQRLRIKRRDEAPDGLGEPDRIFASGNGGAGQDYSPDCALETRGPDTINARSLIAPLVQ
jgi:hypothetical protein